MANVTVYNIDVYKRQGGCEGADGSCDTGCKRKIWSHTGT